MKVPVDGRFYDQRDALSLRFTCEVCTYFDESAERCIHGYPNREHRAAYYVRDRTKLVVFCKDFELV